MAVETVGIVMTDVKNVGLIREKVKSALQTANNCEFGEVFERRDCNKVAFSQTLSGMTPETAIEDPNSPVRSLRFAFKWNDKNRFLDLNLHCDGDIKQIFQQDVQGIIMSLGMDEDSVDVMNTVLNAMSDLGSCFMNPNDMQDIWEQI